MSKRLVKKMGDVIDAIRAEMRRDLVGQEDNMYARGLSTEGWVGGYIQALSDVTAFTQGYTNITTRFAKYWRTEK